MTPSELREAVARVICHDNRNCGCPCDDGMPCLRSLWDTAADAAIALIRAEVLEEAAMRCDMEAHSDLYPAPGGFSDPREEAHKKTAHRIATAIRALKEKSE